MRKSLIAPALLGALVLGGCATSPHYGYDDRGYDRYDRGVRYDRRVCSNCGQVASVERVTLRQPGQTSGGGAVLGAIIGGVLGNTVGSGDGRRAATVAGAVAGGFAGNAVERNGTRGYREDAWLITIDMDDGRWAEVTQDSSEGLRRGDRVAIRGERVHLIR